MERCEADRQQAAEAAVAQLRAEKAAADRRTLSIVQLADKLLGYGPSRDSIREELVNRKVAQLAEGFLAQLKADAIIIRP